MSAQHLWLEVLSLAIEDALQEPTAGARNQGASSLKASRAYFFKQPRADFEAVCHLAGLDPEAVRKAVARRIAEPQTNAPQQTKRAKRAKPAKRPRKILAQMAAFDPEIITDAEAQAITATERNALCPAPCS